MVDQIRTYILFHLLLKEKKKLTKTMLRCEHSIYTLILYHSQSLLMNCNTFMQCWLLINIMTVIISFFFKWRTCRCGSDTFSRIELLGKWTEMKLKTSIVHNSKQLMTIAIHSSIKCVRQSYFKSLSISVTCVLLSLLTLFGYCYNFEFLRSLNECIMQKLGIVTFIFQSMNAIFFSFPSH